MTIGPDGRVYITWSKLVNVEEFDPSNPPEVIHKLRVAAPGRTSFGPERIIDRERRPIFNFKLHANDFRIPPYAKNAVRIVAGRPQVFLIWEGCRVRPLGFVCEEPAIKLRYSNDLGTTWSRIKVLSVGGDNYFPTIANDPAGSGLGCRLVYEPLRLPMAPSTSHRAGWTGSGNGVGSLPAASNSLLE